MTRQQYLILCLISIVWPPNALGGPREDAAADLAKLQGKWRCVEEDSDGKMDKGFSKGHVISFEKELMISYDGDGGVACKDFIKLDPSKSPKEINLTSIFNVLFPGEKGRA